MQTCAQGAGSSSRRRSSSTAAAVDRYAHTMRTPCRFAHNATVANAVGTGAQTHHTARTRRCICIDRLPPPVSAPTQLHVPSIAERTAAGRCLRSVGAHYGARCERKHGHRPRRVARMRYTRSRHAVQTRYQFPHERHHFTANDAHCQRREGETSKHTTSAGQAAHIM
jgi:hypothetical protein